MGTAAAHHTMNTFLLLAAAGLAGAMAQSDSDYANYPEDDFQCPDELEGYFPHAYSCDKYWACVEGLAELRTCGNGLAFIDDERCLTKGPGLVLTGSAPARGLWRVLEMPGRQG